MNQFIIHHTAGEFLVRTELDADRTVELLGERWGGIDVEDIYPATPEDIEINQNQWTDL